MFDLTRNNFMLLLSEKSMDLASKRMTLVASNLANIDTPGYQTRDFSFEEALRGALGAKTGTTERGLASGFQMAVTHPLHQSTEVFLLTQYPPASAPTFERNDGNDVSLDQQNLLMSKAQGAYSRASLFAQTELRKLHDTIRELNK